MKYHEAIVDLIYYILSNGNDFLNLIDSGNAYDKIIRNYHQFNSKGKKVYRNKSLMIKHYRFSVDAWNKVDDKKDLYFEHVYPVKLIKKELKSLILGENVSKTKIRYILDKSEIVVITREEAKLIDKKFKDSIPFNGNDRLQEMNIEIYSKTINNSIFDNF